MRDKAMFLIIAVVCIVICAGCANNNCSLIRFATEQATTTDQLLKEAAIEQTDSSLADTITTTVSWCGNAHSFLSERVKIEGRRVILYNVHGQMDADVNWTIPMSADCIIIYPPIGTDCWVCIEGKGCILFPREVE